MSVIVAKSTVCCAGGTAAVTYDCFPAISVQRIIPTSNTIIIDGVPMGAFRSAHWQVVVSNPNGSLVRSYQILATHRNGSTPTFNTRAILGDPISHTPTVTAASGSMNLNITNTSGDDLIVYATRTAIPLTNTILNVQDVTEIGKGHTFVRAGATSTFDFVTPAQMVAALWSITVTTVAGDRAATQIFAQVIDGVSATQFGILGDTGLSFQMIVTEVMGLGVEIAIQNTGTVDYRVNFTRTPVQVGNILPFCGNSAGVDLWIPPRSIINTGATTNVDTLSLSSHAGAKWLFGAMDTTTFNTMTCEIDVTTPTSTSASHVIWGVVGDFLDLNITSQVIGTNLVLTVENAEPNSVIVNLLRVPIAS